MYFSLYSCMYFSGSVHILLKLIPETFVFLFVFFFSILVFFRKRLYFFSYFSFLFSYFSGNIQLKLIPETFVFLSLFFSLLSYFSGNIHVININSGNACIFRKILYFMQQFTYNKLFFRFWLPSQHFFLW